MVRALDSGSQGPGFESRSDQWKPFPCGGFGKPCNPVSGTRLLLAGEERSLMSGEISDYSRWDLKSLLGLDRLSNAENRKRIS